VIFVSKIIPHTVPFAYTKKSQIWRYIADAPPPLPNIHSVVKHNTHETSAAILQSAEKTY